MKLIWKKMRTETLNQFQQSQPKTPNSYLDGGANSIEDLIDLVDFFRMQRSHKHFIAQISSQTVKCKV